MAGYYKKWYKKCDKVLSFILAYFSIFAFAVFVYLVNVNMPVAYLVFFTNLAIIYVAWAYTYPYDCRTVCEEKK
ncbi:MAG: hypothetical protein JHC26_02675 [Thermofilum sp.]|jgi:ABC-type dipeptide/oligopeptide/nickel transport system permease subunit|uniref:hypothetical protein n=1 Tax=Thermofilum sp. TaxID=1961369 RepID=UPI0025894629|nr:hypothetical protein [Thermofilum sp.]MCI4407970.1 hypothetical protein [Thermofilum sp.]